MWGVFFTLMRLIFVGWLGGSPRNGVSGVRPEKNVFPLSDQKRKSDMFLASLSIVAFFKV